jgi:subtilisin family serine protease
MYTYQLGGKDSPALELEEAQDMVAVRTEQAKDIQELGLAGAALQQMAGTVEVAAFPEANVTVYKFVDEKRGDALAQRDAARATLNQTPGVRFAGRVLIDPATGEPVVYTENLFVKFFDQTKVQRCEEILAAYNLKIKETLPFSPNAFFAEAPDGFGLKVFDLSRKLLQEPEVELCHPELVRQRHYKSIYPPQWHLHRATVNTQDINQHVDVETAWATTTGTGVTIAIIDDGVDVTQEEFNNPGKIVAPRDTLLNVDDGTPKDWGDNHGTCCAGVACASGRFKASGVAPDAKLMPIRIGSTGSMSEAKAFAWAADNGADIISCSWGPDDGNYRFAADPMHNRVAPLPDQTRLAMDYAATKGRNGKGCIILFASGNGNESVDNDGYASYLQNFAIGACNDSGKRSFYSDYGKAISCCFPSNDVTDIPGRARPFTPGIWTTDRAGIRGRNAGGIDSETVVGDAKGNYTATFGGTSSAAPGAAGVFALMLSANPDITPAQLRDMIKNSCDRIDEASGSYDADGHSIFYGYGRLNASKAVQQALAAKKQPELVFQVKGLATLNVSKDASIEGGNLQSSLPTNSRLLGFQVNLDPVHPELSLQYQVFTSAPGTTTLQNSGIYAGTRDKRRKLTGFRIQLAGSLADKYDVIYQAGFDGDKRSIEAQNGALCGIDKATGKAITRMWVRVVRRA